MEKAKKLLLLHLLGITLLFFGCESNRSVDSKTSNNDGKLCFIYQVNNLDIIKNNIKQLDKDCLVVFDVDETLITPVDKLLHVKGFWKSLWFYFFYVRTTYDFLCSKLVHHYNSALFNAEYRLVDEQTPYLIKRLQRKGVKVIALTSCPVGRHGRIKHVEDWRIDQLKKFNIDFSKAFPKQKPIRFLELSPSHPPLFKDGVLFTNTHTKKGELFREFLYRIKGGLNRTADGRTSWKPKGIIFVDDEYKNVKSVTSKIETECVGLHYTAAQKFADDVDTDVAKKQILHLVKNNEWLSDKKVLRLLD